MDDAHLSASEENKDEDIIPRVVPPAVSDDKMDDAHLSASEENKDGKWLVPPSKAQESKLRELFKTIDTAAKTS
jgi:hypothetical protein